MEITSDMIYGFTDSILLTCLAQRDRYGYEINRALLAKSNGRYELKEATLYTAFRRLEKQGYVTSYWGQQSEGARRRYYSITREGRSYLQKWLAEWREMQALLELLFDGKEAL